MRRIPILVTLISISILFTAMPFQAQGQKGETAISKQEKYQVVINHEEQYSIWIANRELRKGWKPVGFIGNKEQALRYIEEVWTDMRPIELRRKMALEIYQKQGKQK